MGACRTLCVCVWGGGGGSSYQDIKGPPHGKKPHMAKRALHKKKNSERPPYK